MGYIGFFLFVALYSVSPCECCMSAVSWSFVYQILILRAPFIIIFT